jgi:2-(1,2-epoxy-1,2-dihydrophenyl)acetyl-CoA isomerase
MKDEVLYQVSDKVATIKINRPDTYNSLTMDVYKELSKAFEKADSDISVRCIVFTGTGKAFSSGAYLAKDELDTTFSPGILRSAMKEYLNPLIQAIFGSEKIIVAAVNGPCAGAAAGIALACDLIIASESAYFLFPFVNIGLATDGGPGFFLTRLAGRNRTMEMLLLGEKVSASKCCEFGIINRVVPVAEFQGEVDALTKKLADGPFSQKLIKSAVNQALSMKLGEYLDLEAEFQPHAARSADSKEGIKAFVEKRKAQFCGQ